jgi:hypothetical protein
MARLGGPDGENLVEERTTRSAGRAVLMRRGIVGPFETWKPSIPYPCLRGDIEGGRFERLRA